MAEDLTNQAEALTDEELQARLDKLEKFYDDQIPRLTKRHEYEKLMCELDEFRLRGLMAKLRYADLTKPASEVTPDQIPKEDGSGSN
jgi:hypothetical protein